MNRRDSIQRVARDREDSNSVYDYDTSMTGNAAASVSISVLCGASIARQKVELVRAGRSPAELENEFEPTA